MIFCQAHRQVKDYICVKFDQYRFFTLGGGGLTKNKNKNRLTDRVIPIIPKTCLQGLQRTIGYS